RVVSASGIMMVLDSRPVEVPRCPVCGSTGSALVLRQADPLMPGEALALFQCPACSLVYLNPRISPSDVELIENQSSVYDSSAEVAEERIVKLQAMVTNLSVFTKRRGRLLDIGCNRGLLLEAARRLGWHVVGVELSAVAAQRAREGFRLEV